MGGGGGVVMGAPMRMQGVPRLRYVPWKKDRLNLWAGLFSPTLLQPGISLLQMIRWYGWGVLMSRVDFEKWLCPL